MALELVVSLENLIIELNNTTTQKTIPKDYFRDLLMIRFV